MQLTTLQLPRHLFFFCSKTYFILFTRFARKAPSFTAWMNSADTKCPCLSLVINLTPDHMHYHTNIIGYSI